jgi:hypothetical protein
VTTSDAQRFFDMKVVVARDIGLLILAAIAVQSRRPREEEATAGSLAPNT